MNNADNKSLEKCSIKAVVDLIKDIGHGVTLIAASYFFSKQAFFNGNRVWFILPVLIAGIFIILFSPIGFHKRYFDARDSLLKRVGSFFLFAAIYFPAAMILFISIDYSQYIASLPK